MLQCRDGRLRGIIPACAGNTGGFTWRVYLEGDHPRVCGEHDTRGIRRLHNSGSSPRVRGTRCAPSKPVHLTGIIPACAGNTGSAILNGLLNGDHPRVCGEHPTRRRTGPTAPGSSPRVRGTPLEGLKPFLGAGIIPACAGNTVRGHDLVVHHRDHPRVCGEHTDNTFAWKVAEGSSPRVRGTLGGVPRDNATRGIIPACAGNTCLRSSCRLSSRDHPRVCGEHLPSFLLPSFIAGSSPRVRGTPGGALVDLRMTGIIPACAGNTAWPWLRWLMFRDHPRVCGEHFGVLCATCVGAGSSPRVREHN